MSNAADKTNKMGLRSDLWLSSVESKMTLTDKQNNNLTNKEQFQWHGKGFIMNRRRRNQNNECI